MESTGFNFGVDPQELVLTLVAFAAQHEFFEMLYAPDNILGWLTIAFGLIGFVSLLLLPANWTAKVIFPWLFLMIVIVARPLGEPFFFSDPITSASNVVNQPVCPGGVLDQEECKRIVGTNQAVKVKNILESRGELVDSSFKMFSPIAATLHVVNTLREGIAVELTGLGEKSLDKHITSIETVRRSATASSHATYALANFQSTCGQRDANFARLAAVPLASALREHGSVIEKMETEPMSAVDALIMFDNFASFRERGSNFAPPLVCATSNNLPVCEDNAYTKDPVIKDLFGKNLRGIFGPKTILLREEQDFERVMAVSEPSEAGDGDEEDPEAQYAMRNIGIDEVRGNLNERVFNKISGDYEKLAEQNVTIAMPLNARAILEKRYDDLDDFSSELDGIVQEIEDISLDTYRKRGAITGALLAGAGAGALVIFTSVCGAVTGGFCLLIVGAGVGLGAWAGLELGDDYGTASIEAKEDKAMEMGNKGVIMSIDNCADLHMFTNLQLSIATINFSYLVRELSDVLADNKDILESNGNDLMGLSARERMDYVLNASIERGKAECEGLSDKRPRRKGVEIAKSAKERCLDRNNVSQLNQMQALYKSERVNQSQAAVGAFIDNAHDTKFGGQGFQLVANLGEKAGPFGIWFKTILGGFGAGTYSAIMPVLVSYASALIIIMTPLLFMIGLAVPTWAGGVILLPILVVAYFQLTKVIFILIGIISSVFIAARDANLVTGVTAGFADLVMATAYTAAFLLTGIIMFALKNPFGAVQQVAGQSDTVSTISGQEALQIAGTAYGITQIPGKAASLKEGTDKALGSASANLEAKTGVRTAGLLSQDMQRHRGEQMQTLAQQEAQADTQSKLSYEDHKNRASGQTKAAEEKALAETAEANKNKNLIGPSPTGQKEHNGNVVNVEKLNNALDSLAAAAAKAGGEIDEAGVVGTYGVGGKFDAKALHRDGTVAYKYNEDALKEYNEKVPEKQRINVETMIENGDAERMVDNEGNKTGEIRIVEHHGYLTNKTGSPSGGSGGPGGGGQSGPGILGPDGRPARGGGNDDNNNT